MEIDESAVLVEDDELDPVGCRHLQEETVYRRVRRRLKKQLTIVVQTHENKRELTRTAESPPVNIRKMELNGKRVDRTGMGDG